MAYKHTNSKGITYYLHKTDVTLRGGKTQTIYFNPKRLVQLVMVRLFPPVR